MAKPYALGRQLAILGLVSLTILAVVVQTASEISKRQTDAEVLDQVQADSFQRLETIRRRLSQAVRARPGLPGDPLADSSEWLGPLLSSTANDDAAYVYAMVVSRGGTILAHSDATQINRLLPEGIRTQIAVSGGRERQTSEVNAWFGEGRIVNHAMPVVVDGAEIGTAHIGVSVPALDRYRAYRRGTANRVFWLAALVCMVVFATGGVIAWWMIVQARKKDEADARRDHLAEVGKLAGGLVHEIRNPLNAMRMQIAVIRGKLKRLQAEEAEAANSQLLHLEAEVQRLQDLATSFLAYGRPPTDNLQEFKAADVLRDVADFVSTEFERQKMAIRLRIDPQLDGATLVMDRAKLRQVLLNLAENARHAMTEGGTLDLSLARDKDGWVSFTLADTGCGIPPESLEKIFDAFFSMKDDGSGLGLAIVKRIVESSGGTIAVQSEVNRGTRFTLRFRTTSEAQRRKLRAAVSPERSEAKT